MNYRCYTPRRPQREMVECEPSAAPPLSSFRITGRLLQYASSWVRCCKHCAIDGAGREYLSQGNLFGPRPRHLEFGESRLRNSASSNWLGRRSVPMKKRLLASTVFAVAIAVCSIHTIDAQDGPPGASIATLPF